MPPAIIIRRLQFRKSLYPVKASSHAPCSIQAPLGSNSPSPPAVSRRQGRLQCRQALLRGQDGADVHAALPPMLLRVKGRRHVQTRPDWCGRTPGRSTPATASYSSLPTRYGRSGVIFNNVAIADSRNVCCDTQFWQGSVAHVGCFVMLVTSWGIL